MVTSEANIIFYHRKHAENRLLEVLPEVERSKILRMRMEPKPEEIQQVAIAAHEFHSFVVSVHQIFTIWSCLGLCEINALRCYAMPSRVNNYQGFFGPTQLGG